MDRSLDSLDPSFLPLAMQLLARAVEANIPILIINTRRTAQEQAVALARHVSWVQHSKHEDGLAIDICPYELYQEAGPDKLQWRTDDPAWLKLGLIGEKIGLRWGGRWQKTPDVGHFELPTPIPTTIKESHA